MTMNNSQNQHFPGGACPQTPVHEPWKSYHPLISNPESAPVS